ncbi:hypothetical protein Vafri_7048, partial [Volvox africanus]
MSFPSVFFRSKSCESRGLNARPNSGLLEIVLRTDSRSVRRAVAGREMADGGSGAAHTRTVSLGDPSRVAVKRCDDASAVLPGPRPAAVDVSAVSCGATSRPRAKSLKSRSVPKVERAP